MRYNSKDQVSKAVIEKVEVFWWQSGIPFSEYKTFNKNYTIDMTALKICKSSKFWGAKEFFS